MIRKLPCFLATALFVGAALAPSVAAQNTVGDIQVDAGLTPGDVQLDINNFTGVNAGLGPDSNYITSTVNLSDLKLVVNLSGGGTLSEPSPYFTLDTTASGGDGISWSGTPEPDSDFSDAISAVLTGTFLDTVFDLSDGTTVTVDSTFTATITDSSGLSNGDFAYIVATDTTSTGTSPVVPEPEPFVLVLSGLAGLAGFRRRMFIAAACKACRNLRPLGAAITLAALLLVPVAKASGTATVRLAASTNPSTGLAGFNSVTVLGTGYPAGVIASGITVDFSTSCGGKEAATEKGSSISAIGPDESLTLAIPASLTAGTYYVSVSGSSPSAFASSSCAKILVSATSTTLAACVPTSSLAVVAGSNVSAYVPFGSWSAGNTGIEEVPLEGAGAAQNFPTTGIVNSCAANSATGEVVCTENSTKVDLIKGTTLSTLTSGSNSYSDFTGGDCQNCGVGINASNNTAVIAMGLVGGGSGPYGGSSGVQILNLANNTFNTPVPLANIVSEDISIDSGRNLILSPDESGVYDLLQIGAGNTLTEYGNSIGGTLDSAAEDCTTGIALSAYEFSDQVYITDLTQAVFTAGSPGTWTAPGQFFSLNDGGYSAGTSGISSAPGSNHEGVVTGEYGGSAYSALLLPSTSGSGTPTLADYAYVANMPETPDGNPFAAGLDPHTVTAYTSPNNNKSYAVFADNYYGYPNWLGVVDLACVLSQPRTSGTHEVVGTATACTRYVAVP
jgi:hypothetical protein